MEITPLVQGEAESEEAGSDIESGFSAIKGAGQSLSEPVRNFFEPRFGFDFSGVMVHTGTQAAETARSINARAYTFGNNVVFGAGQYQPQTIHGKQLLAHELTHVVQQKDNISNRKIIQRKLTDEEKKYDEKIYAEAIPQNLANWEVRDKFYNLFAEVSYGTAKGIFPGSTPVAYVNHVYDIQQRLKTLWKSGYTGKANGIIDEEMLLGLQSVADFYEQQKKTPGSTQGIDPAILERFLRIKRNRVKNPPLESGLAAYEAFNRINQNSLFGVSLNDTGDHITYLKEVLFDMNYLSRDDVNNKYDRKAYEAIIQFQLDTGLEKQDGIVGPKTLQLLDRYLTGKTSAFITPGSRFIAKGFLSETITIFTDGDGDQKKELRLVVGKKGNAVTLKIHHTDSQENRGPLSFSFPALNLGDKIWVYEYQRSNGLDPTIIKLQPVKKSADSGTAQAAEGLITIKAPTADNPGLYHFNDQPVQFNAKKFKPLYGFATGEQVNITNPTFMLDVGPYSDTIKLFFKGTEGSGAEGPDPGTGRTYKADLYLIGQGKKNILFAGEPMNVRLKSKALSITVLKQDINVMEFDLDGDGVKDIALHYRISPAQSDQRPDFDRYIDLFFDGPALDKPWAHRMEKIGEYYVGRDKKSEELFKQTVPAIGNEQLANQTIPEDHQKDIATLNNLIGQIYLKALEEDLIKADTYLAWKKLDISLQYLNLFVANKATLSEEDKDRISKTAAFADEYLEKIRRDAAGKETTSCSGNTHGSRCYIENPYTGDSETIRSGGIGSQTTTTRVKLGDEIRNRQWSTAKSSFDKLADGFNLWVSDRLREKHTDDPTLASQTRGAYLYTRELQALIDNPNVKHLTRLKAVYYNYERYLKEKGLPAIELPLYYYYDTSSRKWWILDLINPAAPYRDHVELDSGETSTDHPPKDLFDKLNSKNHLPKGMLLYATPDQSIAGQVELTEPWEWKDILAWFAAAVGIAALVGSIVFSGGAATPVAIQIMFAVSAVAGGAAAGIDLYEHYKNEDLTPTTAMLDIGNIAASIVGLSALASGRIIVLASQASIDGTPWVGTWAKLALTADKAYVPLAGLNIGLNGFNIAILTEDTLQKLDEIDKSAADEPSRDRAKILLLSQLAFAGGMTILSLKGDIASLSKGTNIVIYPGKNGIPVAASAAEGIKALPVEELNLRAEDEFDQVLAIREKLFGKAAATEISKLKDNPAFMKQYSALNKEVYDILNNPTLDVAAKKQILGEKIQQYEELIAGQKLLNKAVFDTAKAKELTAALTEGNFGMRMTMRNGTVSMEGAELGGFPELVERIKSANQTMRANGSDKELVLILMPSVTSDGLQEIMILSRKRWTIPTGAKPNVSLNALGRPDTSHQQYIIDVGSGTSSFAIDMIPAADRQGSIILNTEYAPTFMEPSMTRSNLTWKNAAAKTDENTVVIIGDPLKNMHEIAGDKAVRQVFLNNVNAHLSEAEYMQLAEQLAQSMDKGGRVLLQWTTKPEYSKTLGKDIPRGHIEGVPLEKALVEAGKKYGRQITVEKDLAPIDYNYGITPSKDAAITPDKPLTPEQRRGVTDPVPEHHWDFIFN